MKRKLIIVSASVLVLAFIVGMGFYAQSRNGNSKGITTELTNSDIPENCKKCPELEKCMGDQGQTPEGCEVKKDCSKCDKKEECTKSGTCDAHKEGVKCDPAKCAKCDKKETCPKASTCDANKTNSANCASATTCTRSCNKK